MIITTSHRVVVSSRLLDEICDCLVVISVHRLARGLFGIADLSCISLVSSGEVEIVDFSRFHSAIGLDRRLEFYPQLVTVKIVVLSRFIVDCFS